MRQTRLAAAGPSHSSCRVLCFKSTWAESRKVGRISNCAHVVITDSHTFRAPSGHPSVRHRSHRPCHAGAARHFLLIVYISRIFGSATVYMIWTARPVGSPLPLPCTRRGIEPPFPQQDGQHILQQVINLFAANTIVLVARYRQVCHERQQASSLRGGARPNAPLLGRLWVSLANIQCRRCHSC